ncbi:Endonuclease/exonuclease/phosphatase, partial [Fimicolochytrium jonesii]|uniref:Endonuclease/exonuclease/phosphatase n=1 Tax=Fimicolochytrium jonesii TaxID=1396493 RepID=UPI0022FEAE7A
TVTTTLPISNNDDVEGRVLVVELDTVSIINVYYPNGGLGDTDQQQQALLTKCDMHTALLPIAKRAQQARKHVVFAGDFNIAQEDRDIHPSVLPLMKTGVTDAERTLLSNLASHDFVDTWRSCHPHDISFTTWWIGKHARANNIGLRLDYIFLGLPPESGYPPRISCTILADLQGSDHVPLLLNV